MKNNLLRKSLLGLEMLILFVASPVLFYFNFIPIPKAVPLLIAFGYCLFVLLRDRNFDRRQIRLKNIQTPPKLFLRFAFVAILASMYVIFFEPERLFFIPHHNLTLWLLIVFFYPLWSAYPQELIYRAFFFHRYKALIKKPLALLLLNAGLFAFLHIIFNNWVAVVASFAGGLFYAGTYLKTKSLMTAFLEHTLYGDFIFTIGLGYYFYVPDF